MSEEKPLRTREVMLDYNAMAGLDSISPESGGSLVLQDIRLRTNNIMRVLRWVHSGLVLPRTDSRVGGGAHSLLLSRRCTPF